VPANGEDLPVSPAFLRQNLHSNCKAKRREAFRFATWTSRAFDLLSEKAISRIPALSIPDIAEMLPFSQGDWERFDKYSYVLGNIDKVNAPFIQLAFLMNPRN